MKQNIKIILFSSLIGLILAGTFFLSIKNRAEAKNRNIVYAFQVGVFRNLDNANNFKNEFVTSKIVKDNEYYRVFIGITMNNEKKLEDIFNKYNYDYYIKTFEISEEEANDLKKYDEVLKNCSEENNILVIKEILAKFKNEL